LADKSAGTCDRDVARRQSAMDGAYAGYACAFRTPSLDRPAGRFSSGKIAATKGAQLRHGKKVIKFDLRKERGKAYFFL
jgi:hypothetical protein